MYCATVAMYVFIFNFLCVALLNIKAKKTNLKVCLRVNSSERFCSPIRVALQLFYTNFVLNDMHTFSLALPRDKLLCGSI